MERGLGPFRRGVLTVRPVRQQAGSSQLSLDAQLGSILRIRYRKLVSGLKYSADELATISGCSKMTPPTRWGEATY